MLAAAPHKAEYEAQFVPDFYVTQDAEIHNSHRESKGVKLPSWGLIPRSITTKTFFSFLLLMNILIQ